MKDTNEKYFEAMVHFRNEIIFFFRNFFRRWGFLIITWVTTVGIVILWAVLAG